MSCANSNRSAYDKANDMTFTADRVRLLLRGIEILIKNELDGTKGETPTETAEIVLELVKFTQSIVKEIADVTGQVAFELSTASANCWGKAAIDPGRPAPVGPI